MIICIVSRIVTSIFYIEDIDSLRFFLSAIDFNILEGRPHFPGYPVYCFILNVISFITGSISISFSLIGAFSIFSIIYFSNKIWHLKFKKKSYFLIFLIIFNPFLWIMSNRYMPDILGLSLLTISTYYFLVFRKYKLKKSYLILAVTIGFLAGVRISYLPFVIPFIYYFIKQKEIKFFLYLSLSILIWLFPLILLFDFTDLWQIFIRDLNGHFFNWGGTIYSNEISIAKRLYKMFEFLLVDGIGFWKNDRTIFTLINSIILLIMFIYFFTKKIQFKKINFKPSIIKISICSIIYILWVLFFQNIYYKPRHIIPIILVLIFIISYIFERCNNKNNLLHLILTICFVISYLFVSIKLNIDHTQPSAISQIKSHFKKESSKNKLVIFTEPLMKLYFSKQLEQKNIKIYPYEKLNPDIIKYYHNLNYTIYSTKQLYLNKDNLTDTVVFYHNPYVNRLWSTLKIYKYEKN